MSLKVWNDGIQGWKSVPEHIVIRPAIVDSYNVMQLRNDGAGQRVMDAERVLMIVEKLLICGSFPIVVLSKDAFHNSPDSLIFRQLNGLFLRKEAMLKTYTGGGGIIKKVIYLVAKMDALLISCKPRYQIPMDTDLSKMISKNTLTRRLCQPTFFDHQVDFPLDGGWGRKGESFDKILRVDTTKMTPEARDVLRATAMTGVEQKVLLRRVRELREALSGSTPLWPGPGRLESLLGAHASRSDPTPQRESAPSKCTTRKKKLASSDDALSADMFYNPKHAKFSLNPIQLSSSTTTLRKHGIHAPRKENPPRKHCKKEEKTTTTLPPSGGVKDLLSTDVPDSLIAPISPTSWFSKLPIDFTLDAFSHFDPFAELVSQMKTDLRLMGTMEARFCA